MKINFISNIAASEVSGGISGMNAVAYSALSAVANVRYVGPINPPSNRLSGYRSKIRRSLGIPGEFYFFNEPRLQQIADEVARQCDTTADLDFYMGFTPWILCSKPRPYIAWNDCSFNDYLKIYHNPRHFSARQRNWLCGAEKSWMASATKILLSSKWALQRIQRDYQIPAERFESVGIFGAMEAPSSDIWNGSKDFYFISTNFRHKNGNLCLNAMEEVWKEHPEARLRIIGDPPPARNLIPGLVTYEGFYDKSNARELAVYREHLENAFALIHPTDADIAPLTVIEAGYFGCPTISVDDFALREVTSPSNHNLLLRRPLSSITLGNTMIRLLNNNILYRRARYNARAYAISNHSQDAFRKRFYEAIVNVVSDSRS